MRALAVRAGICRACTKVVPITLYRTQHDLCRKQDQTQLNHWVALHSAIFTL